MSFPLLPRQALRGVVLLPLVGAHLAANALLSAPGADTTVPTAGADPGPALVRSAAPPPCHPQPAPPAPGTPEAASTSFVLVVRAATTVRLDDAGSPVAARTNTGQAPCATDDVLVETAAGTVPATPAQRARLLARVHGLGLTATPWTPGDWRSLQP